MRLIDADIVNEHAIVDDAQKWRKNMMDDLISRKAAIDVFRDDKESILSHVFSHIDPYDADDVMTDIEQLIENVPSAQPEIIRCKDCKHNVSSHKCLHPESFFLVTDDDFYCGYAERRTDG